MSANHGNAIPLTRFPDEDDGKSAQRGESPQGCRVLVVDDDVLVRSTLCAILQSAQYEVEVAASGMEAIAVLDSTPCDIVLTDWQMPDMDGLALCRRIRQSAKHQYIYVLMLTIRNTESDRLAGLAAGADAFVVKGVPFDHILVRLDVGRRMGRKLPPRELGQSDAAKPCIADRIPIVHDWAYLAKRLPQDLFQPRLDGHSLAVLTCTIDALSVDNDCIPSKPSAVLLRDFAVRANGCIRKTDWMAQAERNQFMIVLPDTSEGGAMLVAQRLRRISDQHPMYQPPGPYSFVANVEITSVNDDNNNTGNLRIMALLASANRLQRKRRGTDTMPALEHAGIPGHPITSRITDSHCGMNQGPEAQGTMP